MAKQETEKPAKQETEFLNPFGFQVSYKDFLAAIPKGKTVREYCEGNLPAEDIDWLENDLKHYEKNK